MIFFRRSKEIHPLRTLGIMKEYPSFNVVSSSFKHNERIPVQYTCDGLDISPHLKWENPPAQIEEQALIMYDPDAPIGIFYHWLLYGIKPDLRELPENVPKQVMTNYGVQGVNDFGKVGYGGPCPPPGRPHRYVFLILGLDRKLDLPAGLRPRQLLNAVKDHIVAYGAIIGLYGR